MRNGERMIGYNRTVRLRWLEQTVELILAGQDEKQIREILTDTLGDQLSVGSNAKRGSREKTITLLTKTWLRVPARLAQFRDEGLSLFKNAGKTGRMALHWGMSMAAYPFWRSIADATGRLFRLQGTASASQVQRRIKEVYGEREAAARSARYVLRAFADWGVIRDTAQQGVYVAAPSLRIDNSAVVAWLLEATIHAGATPSSDWKALLHSPALFPFQLVNVSSDLIARSGRIEIVRHSLGDELLIVREQRKTANRKN
jgi:hypothetical protein